ncbi:MAG: putative DNA binding domain-containing protein [Atopobiaceae bacterium]|nr:putative DNA binding domain-containing protein [Atopobiaceae bacterium]
MDLSELDSYRENNRLEAKKAQGRDGRGELPRSVWETVSAFANTAGGVILLGVGERKDHTLFAEGLERADKVLDDFWNAALSKDKLSTRFMCDADASIEEVDGKRIVVIRVPWVDRRLRPVFINDDLFGGTFRRTHTGDHLCEREEVLSMLRDSATSSQDADIAGDAKIEQLDRDTIGRYRRRFDSFNEGHVWSSLSDTDFLCAVGAAADDGSGTVRPTYAGLLMFGEDRWITRELPHYLLDYRQETGDNERWEDRVVSFTGDWTGNVFDFYFRVYNKMKQALKVPFRLEGVDRIDDTPAHKALREALANCLTNANYFERRGVVCLWREDGFVIVNPGDFRMPIEEARKPGSSDPRNETLLKMFAMVEVGERAGSGMDKIYAGWEWAGYGEPTYEVGYGPDRTTLVLPLRESGVGQVDRGAVGEAESLSDNEREAIRIAAASGRVTTRAVVQATGLSRQASATLLRRLSDRGILKWHGKSANDPHQYYSL